MKRIQDSKLDLITNYDDEVLYEDEVDDEKKDSIRTEAIKKQDNSGKFSIFVLL